MKEHEAGAWFAAWRPPWSARALLIGLAVGVPGVCSAHSRLQESSPRADAVLDAPSAEVRLRFSEALEPARTMSLALPRIAAGAYEVQWVAVGHDGHRVAGSYAFSVK